MSRLGPHGLPLRGIDATVTLTGAESSAEAGTVTVTATSDVSPPITGAASAAQAGTVTAAYDWSQSITGAESTADPGTVTVTTDSSVTLTGAESSAESGTVTTLTTSRNLSPLGLAMSGYGPFPRALGHAPGAEISADAGTVTVSTEVNVTLTGAYTLVTAGTVNVVSDTGTRQQFSPHGLPTRIRNFSKQVNQNANVEITGAAIQLQWNTPGFADTSITIDGAEISAAAGTVLVDAGEDEVVVITGAEIGAAAGTVTASGNVDVAITGAEIGTEVGAVEAFGAAATFVTISGAESVAEAGTVTPTYDWSAEITGAEIVAYAAEPGLDTSSDVSVTIYGAEISTGTSAVTHSNVPPVVEDDTQIYGGVLNARLYDNYKRKKRRRKKEREEFDEYTKTLEPTDAEIAQLLRESEADLALKDLEEVVDALGQRIAENEYNERVLLALERALAQGNYSALQAFEREMDRAIEEEAFLVMAIAILE